MASEKRPNLLNRPNYTLSEAAHYLQVPTSTLRAWFAGQHGFERVIEPADPKRNILSFVNLVEVHVLVSIRREHQVPLQAARRAVEFVSKKLKVERPLAHQQFETNGIDLFVEQLGGLVNASRNGQRGMREILQPYLQRIDRDPKGIPVKLYPLTRGGETPSQPKSVVIDPRIAFGRPVLVGTGIPTAILAERFKAGESLKDLATDYGADEEKIQEAIRCELGLAA